MDRLTETKQKTALHDPLRRLTLPAADSIGPVTLPHELKCKRNRLTTKEQRPEERGALSQACSNPTLPPGTLSLPPPSFLSLGVYFSTFSGAICDQARSWQPLFLHLQLGLRA